MTTDAEGTRTCEVCKRELPLSAFWRSQSRSTGFQYGCKACAEATVRRSRKKPRLDLAAALARIAQLEEELVRERGRNAVLKEMLADALAQARGAE